MGRPGAVAAGSPLLTWANLVTAVRMVLGVAMLGVVVVATADPAEVWWWRTVVGLALINLVLDGVDGWLARRFDQSTALGARLDVETDSAVMLIMTAALLLTGTFGPWVIGYGAWRYAYVLAALLWPALRAPLPHRPSRRVIAGIAMGAVIAALAAAGQGLTVAATVIAATGLALVSFSFVRDIVGQHRAATAT